MTNINLTLSDYCYVDGDAPVHLRVPMHLVSAIVANIEGAPIQPELGSRYRVLGMIVHAECYVTDVCDAVINELQRHLGIGEGYAHTKYAKPLENLFGEAFIAKRDILIRRYGE